MSSTKTTAAAPEPATPQAPDGAGHAALLTAALAAAQADFPPIHKGNTAKVEKKAGGSYSYTYADLGDVLNAVRPVLTRHGLAVSQPTRREDGGRIVLVTELRHVAGGILTSEVDLGQTSANPQQFGGALTYLRRYELTTLLGIAAEEDTDGGHVDPAQSARYGQPPAPAPEPPAWAKPASAAAYASAREDLEELIGADRADELLGAIGDYVGGDMPVVVTRTIRGLAARLIGESGPDPTPTPAPAADPVDPHPPAFTSARALQDLEEGRTTAGLSTSDVDRLDHLRELGCICPKPLADPPELVDTCPFPDHGIPF